MAAKDHYACQKMLWKMSPQAEKKHSESPETIRKLGIIAGSGELPKTIIQACRNKGQDIFVIALEGFTENAALEETPHQWAHIGKIGEIISILREQGISNLLLAGRVGRPALSSLKLDFTAMKLLTRFLKLSSQGDDKIFSAIIKFLEDSGFQVLGADQVLKELLIEEGPLGKYKPDKIAHNDIKIGIQAALTIGILDIGQAVIVQQGQILGVEGAEGTDRLIARCKELHNEGPGGVLVKMKKPGQDTRVDLPSIGVDTIENAKKSGLRGIAVEARGSLVINRTRVIEAADRLGLFVVGVSSQK